MSYEVPSFACVRQLALVDYAFECVILIFYCKLGVYIRLIRFMLVGLSVRVFCLKLLYQQFVDVHSGVTPVKYGCPAVSNDYSCAADNVSSLSRPDVYDI